MLFDDAPWIILSKIIAHNTIARPASRPLTCIKMLQRRQNVVPKSSRANQRSYHHHRQTHHDALVDPRHNRRHRQRQLRLKQDLIRARPNANIASMTDGLTC